MEVPEQEALCWLVELVHVWQNVEENECRRAHDMAVEAYTKAFDKETPPDEVRFQ